MQNRTAAGPGMPEQNRCLEAEKKEICVVLGGEENKTDPGLIYL
jgi:hypothetical protein